MIALDAIDYKRRVNDPSFDSPSMGSVFSDSSLTSDPSVNSLIEKLCIDTSWKSNQTIGTTCHKSVLELPAIAEEVEKGKDTKNCILLTQDKVEDDVSFKFDKETHYDEELSRKGKHIESRSIIPLILKKGLRVI